MEQKIRQAVHFFVGTKLDLPASFDKSGLTHDNDTFHPETKRLMTTDRRRTNLEKMGKAAKWVYKDVLKVRVVNSLREQVEVEVNEDHKQRFPEEWNRFINSPEYQSYISSDEDESSPTFTPISVIRGKIKGVGPATIKDFEAAGFTTVESVAEADPDEINHIRKWKQIQEAAMELI